MDTIQSLRAELYTLNAERFGLQTRVAELNESVDALIEANDALRTENEALKAAAPTSFVDDFVAFPKFAVDYAATTLSDLWAKVPSISFEWVTDEARRRTSRLGPSVS
jgi:hypothetical protein